MSQSLKSIRLKAEWARYKKKTGATQQGVSKELGWSVSFFGKILNGNNECSAENLVKICNFFDIPPTTIDSDFDQQTRGLFNVQYTSSGDTPPKSTKLFRPFYTNRVIVWNDMPLTIWDGERKTDHKVSANCTLVCTPDLLLPSSDPDFPPSDRILWLILDGKNSYVLRNPQPPKKFRGKLLRVVAITFV